MPDVDSEEAEQAAARAAGWLRSASLWVDTNVMHEIMGQGDLFRDYVCGPVRTEWRRMRLQGSLWFAMVLDECATCTLSFWHEVDAGMVRIARPGTDAGIWSAVATHLLQPYVFPGWRGSETMRSMH